MKYLSPSSTIAGTLCLMLAIQIPAQVPPASPATSSTAAAPAKSFSQAELEQLLAPIALYPDALLAQILMASTYPIEVVSAERWVKANPKLKDKALEDALQSKPWDPAVKSLTVFPQVLTMMSEQLDWTQKLGDAFLAQQADVMATAQALRNKAVAQGTLKDSKEQKIVTEVQNTTTIVKIEPVNPEVIYVPTYNPTVVYGAWPYPAYPPYYWYPPYYPGYGYGYGYGGALWGFTAGVIVGAALWGNCNWRGGNVNVNVNRYNNFNRSNISNGNWGHNANHRGSVPYRDKAVAQQYGRRQSGDAASREAFRGRAESGRQSISRGDVGSRDLGGRDPGGGRASTRPASGAGSRDFGGSNLGGSNRGSSNLGSSNRGSSNFGSSNFSGRDTRGMNSPTAFDTGRGSQTRDYGSRGSSSIGSARSSGNFGGGGGSRGGGGGGGRGGGGGGRR